MTRNAQTPPTGDADIMTASLGTAIRDQKQRQERLRHVQEFLATPTFLDLGKAPIIVSDDAAALAEYRRDLSYRISVLQSVLALLTEERDLLDRAQPADAGPNAGPNATPDPAQA